MRIRYLAITLLASTVASGAFAQAAAPAAPAAAAPAAPAAAAGPPGTPTTAPAALVTPPATETVAPDIAGVVKGGTKVQILKQGLNVGTEGPIALNDGSGAVLFTNQQGNTVTKIDKDGNFTTFLDHLTGINAITITRDGKFVGLQRLQDGGKAQIAVIYPKGQEKVLSDNINGMPLLAPNDLISDKKGGIYFTVPGAMPPAVYYITPDGKTVVATTEVTGPNGLTLNKDETVLYVNASTNYLRAFDIQPDGSLKNARDTAKYQFMVKNATTGVEASGADGIVIDNDGRFYICTNGGVEIFDADYKYLGVIPLARKGQNLGFAGPDKKTLYVVGTQVAWKIDMLSQGFLGRAK